VRNKYLESPPPWTCAPYSPEHRKLCDLLDKAAYWVAAGKLGVQGPPQRYRYANLRSLDQQLQVASEKYLAGWDRGGSAGGPHRQVSLPGYSCGK
jgi:hypothetical protein